MLTPVEEVRATILAACSPLPAVDLPLAEALGCVAATAVTATADVPPFANTAMDGYAVQAADTAAAPVRLEVVGVLPAGAAPDRPVAPGQAIRIMTGAPMPPGADAVVMVERTAPAPDGVIVQVAVEPGLHVRAAGSDVRAGQEVVAPGTELTPAVLGVIASVGRTRVNVHARPRVGVLSTGDELVQPPAPLRTGQIYDANRPMLLGLVAEAGTTPVDLGAARDDPDTIAAALEEALVSCDAVLLTGGVSVGDFDFVKDVFGRFGDPVSWEVAMKPGKPLAWGMLHAAGPRDSDAGTGRPVFGLPGNPVSAAVSFEMFARPALRRLLGHADPLRPVLAAVADEPLRRRPDGKLHLVRTVTSAADDGRLHVRSAGGQGSHMLGALAAGNSLVLLPDGDGAGAGDEVSVLLLGPR